MIIIDEVLKRIRENIAPVEKSGYYATVYIDNWIYRNTGDDKSNSQDDVELILSGEIFTDEILDFDKEFFQSISDAEKRLTKYYSYDYWRIIAEE